MPSRILREGILTSERVNVLSPESEVFYRRLMSAVDDYGRFTAHLALLRAALYPLRLDRVGEKDVQRMVLDCQKAKLVNVYEAEGKRCLELINFRQQVRAKESKFPAPPDVCVSDANQALSTCVASAHLGGVGVGVVKSSSPPVRSKSFEASTLETIYASFPRRVAKPAALKAIATALAVLAKRPEIPDPSAWLLERVHTYARTREGEDPKFTPHPASWFNAGRYDDDPVEWNRTARPGTTASGTKPKAKTCL